MEKTVTDLGLNHENCRYSTGICESITAGQGKLDHNGYWSIPCPECAEEGERLVAQ